MKFIQRIFFRIIVLVYVQCQKSQHQVSVLENKREHFRKDMATMFSHDSLLESMFIKFKGKITEAQNIGETFAFFDAFHRTVIAIRTDINSREKLCRSWVNEMNACKGKPLWNYYHYFFPFAPGESFEIYKKLELFSKNPLPATYTYIVARLDACSSGLTLSKQFIINDTLLIKEKVSYYLKNLTLGGPGVYIVTVKNDQLFQEFFIHTSAINCMIKKDKKKLVLFGASDNNIVPPPYDIYCTTLEGDTIKTQTDTNGIAVIRDSRFLKSRFPVKVFLAKNQKVLSYCETILPEETKSAEYFGFISTDRSLYSPGQMVNFAGFIRGKKGDSIFIPDYDSLRTESEYSNQFYKMLKLDRMGNFRDSVVLSGAQYGLEKVEIYKLLKDSSGNVVYNKGAESWFQVKTPVKQKFYINASLDKKAYHSGEKIILAVECKGPKGETATATSARIIWANEDNFYRDGPILDAENYNFDKSGKLQITFDPYSKNNKKQNRFNHYYYKQRETEHRMSKKEKLDWNLIAEIRVSDSTGYNVNDTLKTKIRRHNLLLELSPELRGYIGSNYIGKNDTLKTEVKVCDIYGNGWNGTCNLEIFQKSKRITKKTISITNGLGIEGLSFKRSGNYMFRASVKDVNGDIIARIDSIEVINDIVCEHGSLSLDKDYYYVGDTATVTLNTYAKHAKVFYSIESDSIKSTSVAVINNFQFINKIPITDDFQAVNVYSIAYPWNGLNSSYIYIRVANGSDMLKVTIDGKHHVLSGEKVNWDICVKDGSGKPVKARLSASILDETIDNYVEKRRFGIPKYPMLEFLTDIYPTNVVTSGSNLNRVYIRFHSNTDRYIDRSSCHLSPEEKYHYTIADDLWTYTPPPIIQDTITSAYWNSTIITDSKGKVTISFVMPNDTAMYKIVLSGTSGANKFLFYTDSITTKRPQL